MKKPNFFIIGAGKCGTTSMAEWLGEHPQIFMSDPKEPYFFDTDNYKVRNSIYLFDTDIYKERDVMSLEKYLQIFQNAGDQHLGVGEATPSYLLSHVAVKNILEFNPAARFIVMVRNPVDMALSWHGQMFWSRQEFIEDFEEAWKVRYEGKLERDEPNDLRRLDLLHLQYDKVCKLGEQVQRLLKTVDAKSVLFIVMDDLISDPLQEYQRVLEFLDVPYNGKSQFSPQNVAMRPRYKLIRNMFFLLSDIKRLLGIRRNLGVNQILHKFNRNPHKTQLRPDFKQELIEFFKEDVNLLSSLLDRDLSHWLR